MQIEGFYLHIDPIFTNYWYFLTKVKNKTVIQF